jgi:flagellar protein FliO/FliZ
MRHKNLTYRYNIWISVILTLFFVCGSLTPALYAAKEKADPGKVTADKQTEMKNDAVEESAEEGIPGVTKRDYSEEDFKPAGEEESYAWMVIKTILILAIMVGGFYYFFRFVTKQAGIQVRGQDFVQTLAMVPVGQNKYIQVVDLAGKVLVLGVSDNGINLITEIVNHEEIDRIRVLGSQASVQEQKGFQEYFKNQIGKVVDKISDKKSAGHHEAFDMGSGEKDYTLDYLKQQKDRLKNLNGKNNE